jgi:tripartite-type tricarboxylate transporter receptor subunit TctC
MRPIRFRALIVAVLALTAGALAMPAAAQTWPNRPVKIIVPYPAGGNVDLAARLVVPGLTAAFGQPFVVENKPGASGIVGSTIVAKAPPDGYTFLFGSNANLILSPVVMHNESYYWERDFAAVSSIWFVPLAMNVNPKVLPVTNLAEFVALAKQKPDSLSMATAGAGSSNHLLGEKLQELTGASWTTVHYNGNAPANADLLGGHIDFNFDQLASSLQYLKDGSLRALAVTSPERVPDLPNVPTFIDLGYPEMEAATFVGAVAPHGTPREILDKLHDAIAKTLQDEALRKKVAAIGARPQALGPDEFFAYLTRETNKWIPMIKRRNIRAD